MTVMKTNNFTKDGLYDCGEWSTIHVSDVSFRLVVTPTDDVNKAYVSLVAVPRKLTEMSSLPGNPTGLAAGYPVVEVLRLTAMMTGIQEPLRRDGVPVPALPPQHGGRQPGARHQRGQDCTLRVLELVQGAELGGPGAMEHGHGWSSGPQHGPGRLHVPLAGHLRPRPRRRGRRCSIVKL